MPLLEAMAAGVPVLAYGTTAVPETMGGAGVVFTPKDLEYAAELMGRLTYDDGLRAEIIRGQYARLEAFSEARLQAHLDALLAPFV